MFGGFWFFLSLVGEKEMVDQNLLLLLPSLLLRRKSFKKTHRFELLPAEEEREDEAEGVVSKPKPSSTFSASEELIMLVLLGLVTFWS